MVNLDMKKRVVLKLSRFYRYLYIKESFNKVLPFNSCVNTRPEGLSGDFIFISSCFFLFLIFNKPFPTLLVTSNHLLFTVV